MYIFSLCIYSPCVLSLCENLLLHYSVYTLYLISLLVTAIVWTSFKQVKITYLLNLWSHSHLVHCKISNMCSIQFSESGDLQIIRVWRTNIMHPNLVQTFSKFTFIFMILLLFMISWCPSLLQKFVRNFSIFSNSHLRCLLCIWLTHFFTCESFCSWKGVTLDL